MGIKTYIRDYDCEGWGVIQKTATLAFCKLWKSELRLRAPKCFWNNIAILMGRRTPFSVSMPTSLVVIGWRGVFPLTSSLSASATHRNRSVRTPFTSCTVLPSFKLHSNRKAKGAVWFLRPLNSSLRELSTWLLCRASQMRPINKRRNVQLW